MNKKIAVLTCLFILTIIYFIVEEFLMAPEKSFEINISSVELQNNLKNQQVIEAGRTIYAKYCSVCHGENLEGRNGPNLTDRYWIHGQGTPESILEFIANGATQKGMPAWKSVLTKEELISVTVFVTSQQGSQPKNAKSPQGVLIDKK